MRGSGAGERNSMKNCKKCKHLFLCGILAEERPNNKKIDDEICKSVGGFKEINPIVFEISVQKKEAKNA